MRLSTRPRPPRLARPHAAASISVLLALAAPPAAPLAAQTAAERTLCEQAVDRRTQYPDARGRLQAAAQGSGESADFARGCLAMADEQWNDAVKAFERTVNADGRSAVYHFWLGRAYGEIASTANVLRQAGLARKVKGEFDRAVQLDPDYLDAREGLMQYYLRAPGIMGGSVEKAAEQVGEIRKRDPYRGGLLAVRLADRRRDWAGAAREYEQLAAQYPDSAQPHSELVLFHARARRWEDAFRAVDRWLAAQPGSMPAHYAVGRTAAESGLQLDRGEEALKRYIAGHTPKPTEPSIAAAHWRLGSIHERRGRRDAARAEYQTAIGLDPKLKQAQDALAKLK